MATTYGPAYYLPNYKEEMPKRELRRKIPEIFIEADRQMAELHKNDPKPMTRVKEIPMPFIAGCPGAEPVVFVTEDWYVKHEKKRLKHIAQNKREAQIEMMELLTEKDRINRKLGELTTSKKKNCKKIVKLNIKIRDIDAELEALQYQFHVSIRDLERGTRFDRFIGRIKRGIMHVVKKIKSFFVDNKELVNGAAAIGIPAVLGFIIKKVTGGLVTP